MSAQMWIPAYRLARLGMNSRDTRVRRLGIDLARKLVRVTLPVYLLPALLAVLLVGGFGVLVVAVVESVSDSGNGPRGRHIVADSAAFRWSREACRA